MAYRTCGHAEVLRPIRTTVRSDSSICSSTNCSSSIPVGGSAAEKRRSQNPPAHCDGSATQRLRTTLARQRSSEKSKQKKIRVGTTLSRSRNPQTRRESKQLDRD